MTIKVKESGRLEEIRILDFDYGSEWTAEYIDACTYEEDEDGNVIMSEEEYAYWVDRAEEYEKILDLREELDNEELYHDLAEEVAGYGAIEDTQQLLIALLRDELGYTGDIDSFNRYLELKGYQESMIYPMEELDSFFSSPLEAIWQAFYGGRYGWSGDNFNPNDNYFTFNEHGNLISIHKDDLKQYMSDYRRL